ncbi:hypothetical protein [Actinomadura sp. 3N508]|uniref:hypothetical protein n=1 Tax=Actinomadura sp. 3N508 TaxID=3375153 RepID=UPI0037ADCA9F
MRLVSVIFLGTVLVAAGMLAPGTGDAVPDERDGVSVRPEMVKPGERVRISVPRCDGVRSATSEAFTGHAVDGAAAVRPDAEPRTYAVVAYCGSRKVTGEVRVTKRHGWPELLPADRKVR